MGDKTALLTEDDYTNILIHMSVTHRALLHIVNALLQSENVAAQSEAQAAMSVLKEASILWDQLTDNFDPYRPDDDSAT